MKQSKLILWSVTSALAGFLFGFDTIVISGAEEAFQKLWKLDGFMHGLAMSMALWGTVVGAIFGGIPTAKYGRKKTLIWVGILYFISALLSGIAPEVFSFMIARFIGGLGVGASTVAAPMFISEISPANNRGKLAGMFQFNIVFGILVAFLSNYIIASYVDADVAWRWMLGIESLPAIIYTLLAFSLPESPRWLISHAGRREEGAKIFQQINPEASAEEIESLVQNVENAGSSSSSTEGFWSSRLTLPILLAFLIAFFNQFSGINIILYFAPRLLGLAGLENALAASAALGVTNLIFTFVGLWLIDKLGRRSLLFIGSIGYIVSLGVCAFAFLTTPAFEVVSKAGDLSSSIAATQSVEEGNVYYSETDIKAINDGYSAAKEALINASTIEGYEGSPVVIDTTANTEQVASIAETASKEASELLGSMSIIVLLCLIGFIAAHAVGQGAVIWVFISEIFPNNHRASGQALGSSTHWVCAAGLTFLFPIAMGVFTPGILFAFFCGMMVLQLIWVLTMVPETKGVSLEDIEKKLGIAK
ncbi:MAG: sugar porter family MFS transporter [Planctomycetes bacterium]|nr:sugar porter family MFS transporter [Planctomycetota bacterium]